MANDTTTGAETAGHTGRAPGLANLRPPWRKGQSGNPAGRPSHRKLFEEALDLLVYAEEMLRQSEPRAGACHVATLARQAVDALATLLRARR